MARAPYYLLVAVIVALFATAALAEEVTFTFAPAEGMDITSASLRGSFNGWDETAMEEMDDGTWSVTLDLEPGEYQYKYFVNGQWPQDMSTALDGMAMDADADYYADDGYGGQNAVRIVGGGGAAAREDLPTAPPLEGGFARIHYYRPDAQYSGWGLHVWGDADVSVTWTEPMPPTGEDPMGLFWDIPLNDGAQEVGFIVHKGDSKDPGPDMFYRPETHGDEVWIVSGRPDIMTEAPDVEQLALGDISRRQAHWVDARTIAWRISPREGSTYYLHSCGDAGLQLTKAGIKGGMKLELEYDPAGLPREVQRKFPHLVGFKAFKLAESSMERVPQFLKGQLAVSMMDPDGSLVTATGVQIPGVLDDFFAYDGPLGVDWSMSAPAIRVWAPTAQQVWLHLFADATTEEPEAVVPMEEVDGVWSAVGEADWAGKYYVYEVKVFMPQSGTVLRNIVTDPYSRSLSMNSRRTQIVDLSDPTLMPEGWSTLEKPPLEAPEDIVLYELHVRDFSANDPEVDDEFVGTYRAFTLDTNGTRHLKALADAGLTHVHLLPTFDIASVNEDKDTWEFPPPEMGDYPPDSPKQQDVIAMIQGSDPYNWGYDPFHFGVPEGSYSTSPNGTKRIVEFRRMVKALSDMGLRVVMDVVYNHTNASGTSEKSVFDKIVPGYYHRLTMDGFVEHSTCCENTATEHYMMERFMVDDLVHWATDYKIDGFRFDLMGHHMKSNMLKVRDALHALTVEKDGVDGSAIYLYGEGWDFGEVQGGRRGVNATQPNMAGTGIGTFNDRIRDAVRGGSAFSDRRDQGFATGSNDRMGLLRAADRIRVGMAGNLRDFRFTDSTGRPVMGSFDGVGYALDPQEALTYVSAHDNETFFDKIQYAAPKSATIDDRVRMQMVAMSITAFTQGIPFFHAGVDMLRSKSMDADSYNSGDWFNKLDFTYQSNNFGVGLPIAEKNQDRWNIIKPLLGNADITPGPEHIAMTVAHMREILTIRKSTPLFRLRTGEDVKQRVAYWNTGRDQMPGLIVMSVSDEVEGMPDLDPDHRSIVIVVNAGAQGVSFQDDAFEDRGFVLHPVFAGSADEVVRGAKYESNGTFVVPGRTAAVFVEPE
jgi:pullulanase-type alpha-1,6-glucosidase